ncbi:hypothetical protein GOODEAATRI_012157, partial [Goodea atripinnis]
MHTQAVGRMGAKGSVLLILLTFLPAVSRGQKFWLHACGLGVHLPFARPQTFSDQTRCLPVSIP